MALQLARAGESNFVLLEQAQEVGGTWRDNQYPGCACDVPSHLYSFSFEPHTAWSRMYASHDEIQAYLVACSHKHGLREKIWLGTALIEARFDEAHNVLHITTAHKVDDKVDSGLHARSLDAYFVRDCWLCVHMHAWLCRWDHARVARRRDAHVAVRLIERFLGGLLKVRVKPSRFGRSALTEPRAWGRLGQCTEEFQVRRLIGTKCSGLASRPPSGPLRS
jgi:hypothetical protein